MLIVPPGSEHAGLPAIDKAALRGLTFVALDQGATVQATQEHALHRHGIVWHTLRVEMVRPAGRAACAAAPCWGAPCMQQVHPGQVQGTAPSLAHPHAPAPARCAPATWEPQKHGTNLRFSAKTGRLAALAPALQHPRALPAPTLHRWHHRQQGPGHSAGPPAQEFNSVEAIKGAVQHGLGAAFVSAAAIEKEVAMGLVHRLPIQDVHLSRTISLVRLRRHCSCVSCVVPEPIQDVHLSRTFSLVRLPLRVAGHLLVSPFRLCPTVPPLCICAAAGLHRGSLCLGSCHRWLGSQGQGCLPRGAPDGHQAHSCARMLLVLTNATCVPSLRLAMSGCWRPLIRAPEARGLTAEASSLADVRYVPSSADVPARSQIYHPKLRHSTAARKFMADVFCLVTAADGSMAGAAHPLHTAWHTCLSAAVALGACLGPRRTD